MRVPLSKIAEEQSQPCGTVRISRRIFQPNENHHEYISIHRDISLTLHHKIPSRENIYVFKECGKIFNYGSDLINNERILTRKKPYACKECEKAFTLCEQLTQENS